MSISADVQYNLICNVEDAISELQKLQRAGVQTLSILRKLGLPEDINQAIANLQRMVTVMNAARQAAIALQVASGPVGWIIAGVSVTAAVVTGVVTIEDMMRGT